MLPAVARCISYVPMPTVSQVAAVGTAALACKHLWLTIKSILPQGPNLKKGYARVLGASLFALSKIGFVSLAAAAQNKFPLASRVGIISLAPFILKDCVSLIRWKFSKDDLVSAAELGEHINLVVTGVLFYQNRSLFNGLYFGANLANIALKIYND